MSDEVDNLSTSLPLIQAKTYNISLNIFLTTLF